MYVKLLGFLLFVCQIIFNESYEIHPVTAQIPVITIRAAIPVDYNISSDNQTAYKLHQERKSWNDARERCISEGAHLAITDTVGKIRRVINIREYWGTRWLHAGIYRLNTTSQWIRADNGVPATNLPWLEDSPDEYGDCATMSIEENPGLRNYDCEVQDHWFVCEISL